MKVYAAEFLNCIYEGAFNVLSMHWSKATAQAVIDAHRAKEKLSWEETYADVGGAEEDEDPHIAWRVQEYEVIQ